MKKLIVNPFLSADVCIADGEPHVFGDRIYLFGSHDRPGGTTFCELDYEFWSAPLDDLSDWSCKGISYSAKQDPLYGENAKYLYAPDVVKGNDGRYYLYYALAGDKGRHGYDGPISVAVCDTPDGRYEYIGSLKNPDGTVFNSYVLFDPAVINDDGVIRLYFGASYLFDEFRHAPFKQIFDIVQSRVFNKSINEIKKGITGAFSAVIDNDMVTVISEPERILPVKTRGTDFEGHAFFEGSSIRKFGEIYYFIYSSRRNHELCYATSRYPDRGFSYGGTIISNGDIGFQGRQPKDRLNLTGNNHGSIEKINGEYFVFYHRMTNKSTYSRQACAEKVEIKNDGSISQVRMSSSGFGSGALPAEGEYPAYIACRLTKGIMPHLGNGSTKMKLPYISQSDGGVIKDLTDGCVIGFNSLDVSKPCQIYVRLEGDFCGEIVLSDFETDEFVSRIIVKNTAFCEKYYSELICSRSHSLYLNFEFRGKGKCILKSIGFDKNNK
ncbi:MAG: family 43 glycosylhydrolase [Acutalibacteraceae bacterium]